MSATLDDVVARLDTLNARTPLASILVMEFFSSQDMDNGGGNDGGVLIPLNSSIYGQAGGFQITPTDPAFPLMLRGVHDHPAFGHPVVSLSWADYLATL